MNARNQTTNDEAQMSSDEGMANETRSHAQDCPPYRYRPEYVRLSLVGRVTPCAPPFVIRH